MTCMCDKSKLTFTISQSLSFIIYFGSGKYTADLCDGVLSVWLQSKFSKITRCATVLFDYFFIYFLGTVSWGSADESFYFEYVFTGKRVLDCKKRFQMVIENLKQDFVREVKFTHQFLV